jgi:hypothetical protein
MVILAGEVINLPIAKHILVPGLHSVCGVITTSMFSIADSCSRSKAIGSDKPCTKLGDRKVQNCGLTSLLQPSPEHLALNSSLTVVEALC